IANRLAAKQNRFARSEQRPGTRADVLVKPVTLLIGEDDILATIIVPVTDEHARASAALNPFAIGKHLFAGRKLCARTCPLVQEEGQGSARIGNDEIQLSVAVPIANIETRVSATRGDAEKFFSRVQFFSRSKNRKGRGRLCCGRVSEIPNEAIRITGEQVQFPVAIPVHGSHAVLTNGIARLKFLSVRVAARSPLKARR